MTQASRDAAQLVHDALDSLRQELAATNALLLATTRELAASRVETAVRVEGLRAEQNRSRRSRLIGVAAGGVGLIVATDENAQHCSPGARTEDVFNASERGVTDRHTLQHIYDHPTAASTCDVLIPFSSHSVAPYPTANNAFGLTVLGLAALTTWAFHLWRTRHDFAKVQQAAMIEEAHSGAPPSAAV